MGVVERCSECIVPLGDIESQEHDQFGVFYCYDCENYSHEVM